MISRGSFLETSLWTNEASPRNFSFSPSGTPKGILVMIHGASSADHISGVTYGGVAMTEVRDIANVSGETSRSWLFYLGSGIPTGTRTVAISHAGLTAVKVAVILEINSDENIDTQVVQSGSLSGSANNPQIALNGGGRTCKRFAGIYSGHDSLGNLSNIAGCSSIASEDLGPAVVLWQQETGTSSGTTTVGWAASASDITMVAAAIGEVAGDQDLAATATGTADALGALTLEVDSPLTPAYLSWLQRSGRNNWYGLEGIVRREFSGWTLHSGSVYKTTWPPIGQSYAVSEMYENGVLMTQGSSAALSAGQWWQDRSAKPNQVYVRATGSVNPHTKRFIGNFAVRVCSGVPNGKTDADLNGFPWDVRISQTSVPAIAHTLGNVFFGTAVFGSIHIALVNADGRYDTAYADWIVKDTVWTVVHGDGGVELPYADHNKIKFICASRRANYQTFDLTLENNLHVLNIPVLKQIFDIAVYPNMDPNLQGKWIPDLYGTERIPFYPIDLVNGKFKAIASPLQEIHSPEVSGDALGPNDYTVDLANATITITNVVQNVSVTAKVGGELATGLHYFQVAALVRE